MTSNPHRLATAPILGQSPSRDSAEYLKTEEDMQLYLEACIEESGDDPSFIIHALGVIARAKNMSQLARDTGLTREGIYKASLQKVIQHSPLSQKLQRLLDLNYQYNRPHKKLPVNKSRS